MSGLRDAVRRADYDAVIKVLEADEGALRRREVSRHTQRRASLRPQRTGTPAGWFPCVVAT